MPRTDVRNDKETKASAWMRRASGEAAWALEPPGLAIAGYLQSFPAHEPTHQTLPDTQTRASACSRSGGNSFLPPHPHAVSLSCCALPAHPASSPPVYRFARACVALWRFLVLSTTFRTRDLPTTTCALNIRNSPLRRGGDGRLNRAANSSRDIDPAERVLEKTKREEKSCLRESGRKKAQQQEFSEVRGEGACCSDYRPPSTTRSP